MTTTREPVKTYKKSGKLGKKKSYFVLRCAYCRTKNVSPQRRQRVLS